MHRAASATSTCPVQNVDSAEVETFLAMAKISFLIYFLDFPGGSVVKNLPASAGDAGGLGLIPGSGRSPGVGNGNPLPYSCLENPMDRGAWWAAVHGVSQSWTRLSDFTFTFHFHALEKEWQPTPVFLPGESHEQRSLVGCSPWGLTESNTTEAT